jgi:hypothetical protein
VVADGVGSRVGEVRLGRGDVDGARVVVLGRGEVVVGALLDGVEVRLVLGSADPLPPTGR